MDENIQPITREVIAQQVRHAISLGTEAVNPYPAGSDAAGAWEATVSRIKAEEVKDSEGSA
jgi:hypothetical protein